MSLTVDTASALPARRGSRAVGSLAWFAAHETRLIWRDFASLMTGGKPHRIAIVGVIITAFVIGMHAMAAHLIGPVVEAGIVADKQTMLLISGSLIMFFSLMFSQAIESVTRAYYARSDLDLILSSPAPSERLFHVRTSVLTVQTIALSVLIASPLINVLIFMDGVQWISAYLVFIALGAVATSCAVMTTLFLFRVVGTARTRLIAQIIAAVVGAGFVIALQAAAILLGQGITRMSLFSSADTLAAAPSVESVVWLPAQATMGDFSSLIFVVVIAAALLLCVIYFSAKRFAEDVLATAGASENRTKAAIFQGFRKNASMAATLRRKEWKLLARDPWLISQSLQQILYLIPPALLLWVNYGSGDGIYYVVVPVVVMAAGQLAGGLSWISISGEDAHELIETAPVKASAVLRAKVQAVLAVIAGVLSPFIVALGIFSPRAALCLIAGAGLSASCAVLIQLWFRSQAKRSMFRRRQVSSKAATISEALVSILIAAGAGLAIMHPILAVPSLILASVILLVAFFIRPKHG